MTMRTGNTPIVAAILALAVAGPGSGGGPASDSPVGKTFYTKCNIWYENPKTILSTNFHKGGRIPAGTKVKILGFDDGKITFEDEGTGTMALLQVRRHSNVSFQEFFNRHFAEQDPKAPDGALGKFTKDEQANIEAGTITPGMSKDAVLMAYGYPPSHRTPDLKASKWVYWKTRSETLEVNFDEDGKVKAEKFGPTGDISATYALNPVGKQFFTRANIWVDEPDRIYTINYHKGRILPVGTQVDIVAFGDDEIRFTTKDNQEYTLVHLVKYSNVGLDVVFWRYFSEEDPKAAGGAFHRFTGAEQENIQKGAVVEGMSKDAVLMAYGYPPGHRTPDLDHHIWTFWLSRGKRLIVYFRNDHVIAIEPGSG